MRFLKRSFGISMGVAALLLFFFSLSIAEEEQRGDTEDGPDHTAFFTNNSSQKTALLAGSLDMCGTTLAHAIHSASRGQPIVVVAALSWILAAGSTRRFVSSSTGFVRISGILRPWGRSQ